MPPEKIISITENEKIIIITESKQSLKGLENI